jgi:pimeloyl-ACP methyl ester carboxylesterase
MKDNKELQLDLNGNSSELVVVLHAFTKGPKDMASVIMSIKEVLPNADVYLPELPFGLLSTSSIGDVAKQVLYSIDRLYEKRNKREDGKEYESIYFVGHSMGALLARKVYVSACGEYDEAPFEETLRREKSRVWAGKVKRVILLAGMNRGWQLSHHLSITTAVRFWLGTLLGNLQTLLFTRPTIFQIRRGAPFITQLRIQWLTMRSKADEHKRGKALTIQLLGSIDDIVSPEDNIDLVTGSDFYYLDVEKSGHANIIEMNDKVTGQYRKAALQNALTKSIEWLGGNGVMPTDSLEKIDPDVTDVLFVIHGIRDEGFWTQKLARRVKRFAENSDNDVTAASQQGKRVFATETSSYGYFPILPFILPSRRREKVEWLMDKYVEAMSLYPNAKRFHYVGHSNGTYLLAKSLEEYPCCRFDRIVFAGSVVRRKYDWKKIVERKQANQILNYVATGDWVVALFPNGLQPWKIFDLGSAGHTGFLSTINELTNSCFVRGGHSAALNEDNWDDIAAFIVHGKDSVPLHSEKSGQFEQQPHSVPESLVLDIDRTLIEIEQPVWSRVLGASAPLLVLVIIAGLIYPVYALVHYEADQPAKILGLLLYVLLVWKILTKI